jgi:N-acetylmuramoyl-L-alanine amidase
MKKFLFIAALLLVAAPCFCDEKIKILKVEARKIDAYAEVAVYTSQNIKPEILILDSPNRIAMVFHNAVIDSPITIPGPSSLINIIQAAQIDDNTVYVIVEPKEELTYNYASILGRNKSILELSKARKGEKKIVEPSATPSGEVVATATPDIRVTTREVVISSEEAQIENEVATEEVLFERETYLAELKAKNKQGKLREIKPAKLAKLVRSPKKHLAPKIATEEVIAETPQPTMVETVEAAQSVQTAEAVIERSPSVTPEIKEELSKMRGTEISKTPLPLRGYTIMIDPGHGGRDPGYIGKSGILEKNLTYRIALRLYKQLNNAGARVVMTRNGDIEIKNRGIVELANSRGTDLFVAIHLNSFTSPKIRGCETFYYTQQSNRFAKVVQKYLSRTTKMKDRGTHRVTYYVVHHTIMPAILIEAGYLTNPRDEKLILDPDFREVIAIGICKGIKEYVKINPKWQKYHRSGRSSQAAL